VCYSDLRRQRRGPRGLGVSFGDTAQFVNPFPKSRISATTFAERYNATQEHWAIMEADYE
jgi:hypothetical protein